MRQAGEERTNRNNLRITERLVVAHVCIEHGRVGEESTEVVLTHTGSGGFGLQLVHLLRAEETLEEAEDHRALRRCLQ